ncbi:DEAD/DEAH box helicase family protein, partial [Aliarcobacter butzleri]
MDIKLYKHQKTAIKEVFENENGLNKNDRTQLIMACGTGKTLTALKIHETYINKLFDLCCVDNSITVLLFPSLYLVNQTYITYSENFNNKPFNPLIVCSDKKIGNSDEDDIYEIDTDEVNYPVTTQIEDIKRYLLDSNIKHKIVFVTYQSSNLVGTALKELNLIVNFAIFDEAHKTAVKNNNTINGYASALTNDTFPITKRLFMTATPKHYSFKVSDELDEENTLVFSMDNEALYGKVSFEYSMRDAIDDGIIADYKILAILIDDDYLKKFNSISKLKKDGQIDKISNIENEIREVKLRAIEQTMKKFDIKKALAFNSTIEESKKIASFSNSNLCPDIKITHIDSSTSHKNRELIVNNLKNSDEKQILTNARLLSEGFDLPSLELVTILKNMSSTTDIIQTVGRCQRFNRVNGEIINPDKIGYVLLPIFIGDMNNTTIETLKIDSELKSLYEIVNSLKENDKQLRADLLIKKLSRKAKADKLNDELEKLEVSNLEITHINLVDNTFDKKIEKFEDIVTTFIGNIDTIILSSNIVRKEDYIEATLDFCKKFGYEKLTGKTKHNSLSIGRFRDTQRAKFKTLKTEEERQAMIKEF